MPKCQMCESREGRVECKLCEVMYCKECYELHQRLHWTKGKVHPSILYNVKRAAMKRKQQGLEEDSEK